MCCLVHMLFQNEEFSAESGNPKALNELRHPKHVDLRMLVNATTCLCRAALCSIFRLPLPLSQMAYAWFR